MTEWKPYPGLKILHRPSAKLAEKIEAIVDEINRKRWQVFLTGDFIVRPREERDGRITNVLRPLNDLTKESILKMLSEKLGPLAREADIQDLELEAIPARVQF